MQATEDRRYEELQRGMISCPLVKALIRVLFFKWYRALRVRINITMQWDILESDIFFKRFCVLCGMNTIHRNYV